MTETGDAWREFALLIAKSIRVKNTKPIDFDAIANKLNAVAAQEKQVYQKLLSAFE